MSNIFHDLGKTVNEKISGLLDTLRSSTNNWTGDNTFLRSLNIGSDESNENSVDLNVGTGTTPQDINAYGEIKVDGTQNLGNLWDFTSALGEVANNGMASQIANLEARLHKLRTFYPDARPERGEEIGEMIFDLEKSVILVWNGVEWLELGGKVPVTLKIFIDGEGTVTGAGEYSKGEDVYITATPKANYSFKEWTGDGALAGMVQSPTSEGTFINMSQSWMVTAKFGLVDHLLLVTVNGGGSVEGNNTEWAHGTKATIKAIPGPNSDFIEWAGAGVDNPYELESTVTMTEPREVQAIFNLKKYLLTLIADGGTASTTAGTYNFEHGSIAEITATPDSIHNFTNWSGDGITSDPNMATATVEMTEARTITANFSLKEYQLQVQAGTGGTASGSGIFEHFETASITAIADDANGYEFDSWTGDVQTSTDASTTVYIVGPTTVVANFKLKDYALTIQTNDMSNEAPGGGTTIGGGVKEHGETVSITATPSAAYQFHNWTNTTGNPVGDDPFNTDNTYTMSGPFTIVANFKYKEYALTVNAGTGGTASATEGAIVSHFDQAQIVAVPDTSNGYLFDGWTKNSGDGNIDSTSAEDTTVEILSNTEVTANFKLKDYVVYTGVKYDGKISLYGYYPLYETANEANADTDGDGTHHSHEINGVTYYMPNNLPASDQYHGTHTIPWGTFGLYDEQNPSDPDAPVGSWGSSPITKQHGTDGWYLATPEEYYDFDSIEADSRHTLPWLDASNESGPVQIVSDANFIANFSPKMYKLEGKVTNSSAVDIYFNDILNGGWVLGDNALPGLVADGVLTAGGNTSNVYEGDFTATSDVSIRAESKNGYQFVRWIEPSGQNLIADKNSFDTTIRIEPEGDNTDPDSVEFFAQLGLEPIANYTWKNPEGWETDHYFNLDQELFYGSVGPTYQSAITSNSISAEHNGNEITLTNGNPYLRIHSNKDNGSPEYVKVSTNHYWNFNKSWVIFWKGITVQGGVPGQAANSGPVVCGGNNNIYLRKDKNSNRFFQTNARIYNVDTGVGTGVSVGGQDPYNYFKGHGWLHYDHTTKELKNYYSYGDGGNLPSFGYTIDFDTISVGHTANNTEMYLFGVPDNNNVYLTPDWIITDIGMLDSVTTASDFRDNIFPQARDDFDSVSWTDRINITSSGLTKTGSNITAVSLENSNGNNFQTSKIFNFAPTGNLEEDIDIIVTGTNSEGIEKTTTYPTKVIARTNELYVTHDYDLTGTGNHLGTTTVTGGSTASTSPHALNTLSGSNFSAEDTARMEKYVSWDYNHTFSTTSISVIEGTVVDIEATPATGAVFDRWIVPIGYENKVGDINSASTTIEVSGSKDFYIYGAFRVNPEADFVAMIPIVNGARYDSDRTWQYANRFTSDEGPGYNIAPAGTEIELLSRSTAPDRNAENFTEDLIVSESWSATGGTLNPTGDTGIRLHGGLTNYIEIDNPGNCFDMENDWSILVDIVPVGRNNGDTTNNIFNRTTLNDRPMFSRGKWGWGGFLGGANAGMAYQHELTNPAADGVRSSGTNWSHYHWKYSLGYENTGWSGTASTAGSVHGTFNQYGLTDNNNTGQCYTHFQPHYRTLGTTYMPNNVNYWGTEPYNWTSPNNMIKSQTTAINNGAKLNIGWWDGYDISHQDGAAFIIRDIIFFDRMLTSTETNEYMATRAEDLSSLSFYGDRVDHIECGTGTFPSVNGKDGVITGRVVKNDAQPSGISSGYFSRDLSQPYNDYDPSMFVDIPYLTVPSGSGSLDVTHSITTKKGFTDSKTHTITYG